MLWGTVREQEYKIAVLKQDLGAVRLATPAESVSSAASGEKKQPLKIKSDEAWCDFINEYNEFAQKLSGEGTEKICGQFLRQHHLIALTCIKHDSGDVEFSPVQNEAEGKYWAWAMPNAGIYAVVPNPHAKLNQEMHEMGGMKETFASNYKDGAKYKYGLVTQPAMVFDNHGKWTINRPGVIKLN